MKWKLLSIIGLLVCILGWQQQMAYALSCEEVPADVIKEAVKTTPVVFVGKVISITQKEPPYTREDDIATFRVERVYRGSVPERFKMNASMWGDPFEGVTYLMFADSSNANFDSHFCLNTPLKHADFDVVELLGEGHPPGTNANGTMIIKTIGLALLPALVLSMIVWRGFRHHRSKKEQLYDKLK